MSSPVFWWALATFGVVALAWTMAILVLAFCGVYLRWLDVRERRRRLANGCHPFPRRKQRGGKDGRR